MCHVMWHHLLVITKTNCSNELSHAPKMVGFKGKGDSVVKTSKKQTKKQKGQRKYVHQGRSNTFLQTNMSAYILPLLSALILSDSRYQLYGRSVCEVGFPAVG